MTTQQDEEPRIYFCTSRDYDWEPIEAFSPQDAAEKYVLDMQVEGGFVEESTLVTVNVGSTCEK